MKLRVFVSLKPTVLDPQGQTILSALRTLGYKQVTDVRQGKFFDLVVQGDDREKVLAEVEKIADEVLANPVIEEFKVEVLG